MSRSCPVRSIIIAALLSCCCLVGPAGCVPLMKVTAGKNAGSDDLGRRSLGTRLDDEVLEARAKINVENASPDMKSAHVDMVAFNGVVLLVGQVPTEELRTLAESSIANMAKVRHVHNQLAVAPPTSILARVNDRLLSTRIKANMFADNNVDAGRIKVVTKDGVVYLLGLLTRNEADLAVERARKTRGVRKIVKVFEYIDDGPAPSG